MKTLFWAPLACVPVHFTVVNSQARAPSAAPIVLSGNILSISCY